MSWVTIEEELCNNCGLCEVRCPRCFSVPEDMMTAHAGEQNCNICGHCVSLCPTDAITHHKMDAANFLPVDRKLNFDTGDFLHFLRKRRSHRHFKPKKVERKDLELLVEACRYSPTGSNRQPVELLILQNPDRIKRLSDMTLDFFIQMMDGVNAQVANLEARGEEVPEVTRNLHTNLLRYQGMRDARRVGLDVIFHQAPVVVVFHASSTATTPKDDCVIAAQTMSLTALTMGLESCYIGLFTNASINHAPIIEELALPPGHKVCSVLILGYPKIRFFKTVDRKPLRVSWAD